MKTSRLLLCLLIGLLCTNVKIINAQSILKELEMVRVTQNNFLQTQLDERLTKIINTPDFVRAANVSLNALVLSNSLTDYLNDVSNLNNPTNDDLGFSLVHRVEDLLESDILKGKKKKGFSRLMEISKGIIEHPLVSTFTSALPIVSSLGSVMNLVNNYGVQDPDVSIENINNFREDISKYVQHYQGLADATRKFQSTVFAVQERTVELQLILKSFTIQRVENLFPSQIEAANKETSLRKVLIDIYDKEKVALSVKSVIDKYNLSGHLSRDQALTDPRLVYPDYVVNEARFLLDELVAISQEYVIAFNEYQHDLERILEKSKDIGKADQIDRKIVMMREKLENVEKAFLNAVHVEEVEYRFKALVRTQVGS